MSLTLVSIGVLLLYPGRLALKREDVLNTNLEHVNKKTIAIIFAVCSGVFVFTGLALIIVSRIC